MQCPWCVRTQRTRILTTPSTWLRPLCKIVYTHSCTVPVYRTIRYQSSRVSTHATTEHNGPPALGHPWPANVVYRYICNAGQRALALPRTETFRCALPVPAPGRRARHAGVAAAGPPAHSTHTAARMSRSSIPQTRSLAFGAAHTLTHTPRTTCRRCPRRRRGPPRGHLYRRETS